MVYGEKNSNIKTKFFAFILTIFILGILIISGPADAFILSFGSSKTNVQRGDSVVFAISAEAETNEFSNVDNISLILNGPTDASCKFYPNATIISGCNGMSVSLINKEEGFGYGYGYGYGYGFDKSLSYRITLNTTKYHAGTYSTEIIVFADSKTFSKKGEDLTIYSGNIGENLNINGCSIRAKDGKLYVNGSLFGETNKERLSMNFNNNGKGQGSITSQYKRNRFSYSFKLENSLLVNGSNSQIDASGYYRLNRVKFDGEDAVVYINKENKKINIIGENFEVKGMDITFSTKCDKLLP